MKSLLLPILVFLTNLSFGQAIQVTCNNQVGIGTSTPENSENWQRVLDVHGQDHSKVITTTSTIQTGIWSHNSGIYSAPAGGIIGTFSNHPFSIITNKTAKVTILANGNVGIGITNPGSYKLNVSGNSYFTPTADYHLIIDASGYYGTACIRPASNWSSQVGTSSYAFTEMWSYYYNTPSDVRQKENIRNINNALDIVMKLEGVKYDVKKEYAYNDSIVLDEKSIARLEVQRKNKIGFLAQDVYKVLPEVVTYDETNDIYGIDYSKVVPLLVNAIKEQQAQIDTLKQLINMNSCTLKRIGVSTGIDNNAEDFASPYLEQNSPNPFSHITGIKYFVPANCINPTIYVYDMQGLQKKVYPITSCGKSEILINGYDLQPGMYFYTLIIDGKEVDTKRMILTN
jgi:hypothetical protein